MKSPKAYYRALEFVAGDISLAQAEEGLSEDELNYLDFYIDEIEEENEVYDEE